MKTVTVITFWIIIPLVDFQEPAFAFLILSDSCASNCSASFSFHLSFLCSNSSTKSADISNQMLQQGAAQLKLSNIDADTSFNNNIWPIISSLTNNTQAFIISSCPVECPFKSGDDHQAQLLLKRDSSSTLMMMVTKCSLAPSDTITNESEQWCPRIQTWDHPSLSTELSQFALDGQREDN